MNNPPADLGIPILTEIIGPDATEKPVPAAPAARPDPLTPFRTGLSAPPAAPVPVTRTQVPAAFLPAAPAATTTAFAPAIPPSPAVAPAAFSTPVSAAPMPAPAALTPAAKPIAADTQAASTRSTEEWEQLEIELRQNITRQVLGRINFVLDHRVRNSLTDVVDAAIDGLAAEIKRGLHETLEEMVTRAIAQEISRIQSLKK